ncbi:MAG TPA: hypothetical protein VMV92_17840 [Streptosporangiaceae bacterium]|nr:hypothetical protein [Streptosporangiaceae bacterium]
MLVVGLGLGEGLAVLEPDGLGEGLGEALPEGLAEAVPDGLAEAVPDGLAEALAVALLVAFGVAVAVLLAVALAVAFAVLLALAVALGVLLFLAVLTGVAEAASRLTPACLAGTDRTAEVAGGWPHTLGAELAAAASAGLVPAASPLTTPEETMAALATMPSADDPDRADLMAAPSSLWSSSSRPRVSSDWSRRPCAETIPCCRSSTPTRSETDGKHPHRADR